MPRKKNVAKSLIDSAESAIFAGIEIHNKPRIPYRYPTATLLIINAWELALFEIDQGEQGMVYGKIA